MPQPRKTCSEAVTEDMQREAKWLLAKVSLSHQFCLATRFLLAHKLT